jgi:hypothetical protein
VATVSVLTFLLALRPWKRWVWLAARRERSAAGCLDRRHCPSPGKSSCTSTLIRVLLSGHFCILNGYTFCSHALISHRQLDR